MRNVLPLAIAIAFTTPLTIAGPVAAHSVDFKSPGPGMHFTQGQPLVIFADLFDSREGKGIIACPNGQTVSNKSPPPDYSDPPRQAECSGGGTPTGWPAFQILIDGSLQTDLDSQRSTIPNTTAFNHDGNPDPIGFFRFRADSSALAPGPHQIVVHGLFSMNGTDITELDSPPLTIFVDAPPDKTIISLSADFSGTVSWDDAIIVGNGHSVTASGGLIIRNSLVTGLRGISGSVDSAAIEGSTFEDTGPLDLKIGDGKASISHNEFRANNRLTFVASDPSVPFIITLEGDGANSKLFSGNRVGAGQLSFGGKNWLIGGDEDDQSNVLIGPRTVLNVRSSKTVIRGNYSHHNYRGAWSQGFNFAYQGAAPDTLTEHNFIRDSSWPVQSLAGELRYNVVYGFGHTWVRSTQSGASIHHNVFAPGGDGGLNAGIQCYGGETGLQIYNNTFDGGGAAIGDFAGPTIDMSGGSSVASFRNNLIAFSRNQNNDSPGSARVVGGSGAYLYADYNAFYSPDNDNKTNYDFAGAGAHDVSGGNGGQLASNPFAGARIVADESRMIENTIDESAIWQGTQTVSQVLAIFRERYTPKAGSPIIDSGDPRDDDSLGRRSDIGAIDASGHDQDHFGKFGTAPPVVVPVDAGSGATHDAGATAAKPATGASDAAAGANAADGAPDHAGASGPKAAVTGDADASDADARANDLRGGCDCSLVGRQATGRDQRAAPAILLALLFAARPLRRLMAAKRPAARRSNAAPRLRHRCPLRRRRSGEAPR